MIKKCLLPSCLLSLFVSFASFAGVDAQRLNQAEQETQNWLSHGRTYDEQRFSPLEQINKQTVEDLGLSWSFDSGSLREMQATPLVVDGVMYVTGAWSVVFALDAKTGEQLWKHDPKVDKNTLHKGCCGPANRGVAIWGEQVFVGTYDGRLQALDIKTGKVNWSVVTVDQTKDYTITGAPRVVKGKVFIGNGGAELGVRGYISAYDADSGDLVWRFYTVPGNPADGFETPLLEQMAKSWNGEWWKYGGGGTVWDSMSYDPELDLLYFGVGNGSPWNRDIRSPGGGDNLFLSSVVAVRPDTGEYVWHYQETPAETWDYTATQHMILATIDWQGEPRDVLLHAPKNGFFFVLDRATGELLSAEPYVPVTWASHYDMETGRPVENSSADWSKGDSAIVRPGAIGGHNWQPMAYNPKHKLVYIPANDLVQTYADIRRTEPFKYEPGTWNTGNNFDEPMPILDPAFYQEIIGNILHGEIIAWSPEQQKAVWRKALARPGNGGILATAGDLVFQGEIDGHFSARDALTGELVWQIDTDFGFMAAPMSYSIDGEQYISIATGRGGPASMIYGFQVPQSLPTSTRVLTFKLGANKTLPENTIAAPDFEPPALADFSGDYDNGRHLFNNYCSFCHGLSAAGNKVVPDLRRMHSAWHQQFQAVVLGGAMTAAGMPSFKGVLDEKQVADIQYFIVTEAHEIRQDQDSLWYKIKQFVYKIIGKLAPIIY